MLVAWIILSILVGLLGEKKNIGFMWGMLLSILLSPLIGLIIVLVSDKKGNSEIEQLRKEVEELKNK